MKKTIIALTTVLTFAGVSTFAQTATHDSGKHVQDKKDLKDSVGLSDKQADSVIAIHKDFESKVQQLRQSPSASNKQQIKALHEQQEQRLAANLTPEQINKLEAYEKAHKGSKKADN